MLSILQLLYQDWIHQKSCFNVFCENKDHTWQNISLFSFGKVLVPCIDEASLVHNYIFFLKVENFTVLDFTRKS